MPYTAEISRTTPGCFIFLIDQSGSMSDGLGGTSKGKSVAVADAINRLLQNLVIQCSKNEGVRDYFYVSVIGYGARFGPAFSGQLAGVVQAPISMIEANPARIEERTKKVDDGAGGLVEQRVKFPVWFDAISDGGTPMCQAFDAAYAIASEWIGKHPNGYPPIVLNLTDGEAGDGDPRPHAKQLQSLAGGDGNVLLFNLHLSAIASPPIVFPNSPNGLPDAFAYLLFEMSSMLPDAMVAAAHALELTAGAGSRGFVFNADMPALVQFLDIGTRPANLALR